VRAEREVESGGSAPRILRERLGLQD